ncbi:hypothetical protein BAY61_04900 [Prauserella marina]|uniref:Regulatory protein, tetR family n=1 Tax=Prauserella marina TaxID=530584 RepID=A0A222VKJ7_9PSEU|nr:TetR/AcrR family transcriptional regulator [Prauserella marina]ASR34438.1 hypothetical protein BAY61_04900 [Prauserella marina]PWV70995.1 TetR family transcriptional regulator [Prauserella marina]SDD99963.1 regulatory protein, tetR family [Prauserella marina]
MSTPRPVTESGDHPPSRRERFRQATIDEIKRTARAQMADEGPAGLSLRAVARAMNITPSALYRYFQGIDDLITALCVDAYNALADAVGTSVATVDERDPADHAARWWAFARGMREWAIANPADFALIYGTPLPGYEAPSEETRPAGLRFTGTALRILSDAVDAGAIDLDTALIQHRPTISDDLSAALDAAGIFSDRRGIAILLGAWTILQGHLTLELFGHFEWLHVEADVLFDEHVRAMMLTMGFDRAAAAPPRQSPSATPPR